MIQEKKTTWSKSLKESAKREADTPKDMEAATEGEKVEDNDRGVLEETLRSCESQVSVQRMEMTDKHVLLCKHKLKRELP